MGSEDLIDGHRQEINHYFKSQFHINFIICFISSFPMELHMVFYKKQYRNIRSAMENPDGLTVLAFFFNVSNQVKVFYFKEYLKLKSLRILICFIIYIFI